MQWIRQHLYFIFSGLCMGVADTIPGVSGGTLALITGIYHRLIGAIKSADISLVFLLLKGRFGDIWRQLDLNFLLCVFAGIITAILLLVKAVDLPGLMQSHPQRVYALFFGLIIASVPVVIRRTHGPKDRLSYLLVLALGVGLALLIVTQRPPHLPEGPLWMFLSGAVAICAMLLPGISGSFILLMLGQYVIILDAVKTLNIMLLLPFIAGCVVGLLSFSRAIDWLLRHYHNATLYLMGGLLLGSLWIVWPYQHREFVSIKGKEKLISSTPYLPESWGNQESLIIIGLALVGVMLVTMIEKWAKKMPD